MSEKKDNVELPAEAQDHILHNLLPDELHPIISGDDGVATISGMKVSGDNQVHNIDITAGHPAHQNEMTMSVSSDDPELSEMGKFEKGLLSTSTRNEPHILVLDADQAAIHNGRPLITMKASLRIYQALDLINSVVRTQDGAGREIDAVPIIVPTEEGQDQVGLISCRRGTYTWQFLHEQDPRVLGTDFLLQFATCFCIDHAHRIDNECYPFHGYCLIRVQLTDILKVMRAIEEGAYGKSGPTTNVIDIAVDQSNQPGKIFNALQEITDGIHTVPQLSFDRVWTTRASFFPTLEFIINKGK